MKNLENWIVENKPELVGIQNEVKSLIEIANASGNSKVRNGFYGYPTIDLNEIGPFYQRVLFFKKREVLVKGEVSYKFLFAIENMTGMEVMGGNFHFELFGGTLENTLRFAGINLEKPKPVPFILIYFGKEKIKDSSNEYHKFEVVSIVEENISEEIANNDNIDNNAKKLIKKSEKSLSQSISDADTFA
jgi:hypothetical protein